MPTTSKSSKNPLTSSKKKGKRAKKKYVLRGSIKRVTDEIFGKEISVSESSKQLIEDLIMEVLMPQLNEAANQLRLHRGHRTLTSQDLLNAAKLVLPDELARHAVSEGYKAQQREKEWNSFNKKPIKA